MNKGTKKYLQSLEKENHYKKNLSDLERDSKNILSEFYKEECGENYKEIFKCAEIFYNTMSSSNSEIDGAFKLNDSLNKIMDKVLLNIISKKTNTSIKQKSCWGSEKPVVMGSFGFGIQYYNRAQRINNFNSRLDILKQFTDDDINLVWKNHKREILKGLCDLSKKWISPNIDFSFSVKKNMLIQPSMYESYFKLRNKYVKDFFIKFVKEYDSNIYLDYSNIINYDPNNITYYKNYTCFILSQIWNESGFKKQIKKLSNDIKNIQKNNLKLFNDFIDKYSHLIALEAI
jgi:uncharacterized protein YihD (DUF1040 family)